MTLGEASKSFQGEMNISAFQRKAIARVTMVLQGYGAPFKDFSANRGAKTALWTSFDFKGLEHTLAIYEDEINMTQGPDLFECYMSEEFASESALIEGFSTRLSRYLSGGPWEGPDERGLPDRITKKMRKLLRR